MRLTRRDRVRLLLETLVAATDPSRVDSDIRSTLESRPPPRPKLFDQGSYFQVWNELDRLRRDGYSRIHRHLCARYIGGPDFPVGTRGARRALVEHGIDLLARRLPGNIYVPIEVSENGGFSPGEAKVAAMPNSRRAA